MHRGLPKGHFAGVRFDCSLAHNLRLLRNHIGQKKAVTQITLVDVNVGCAANTWTLSGADGPELPCGVHHFPRLCRPRLSERLLKKQVNGDV